MLAETQKQFDSELAELRERIEAVRKVRYDQTLSREHVTARVETEFHCVMNVPWNVDRSYAAISWRSTTPTWITLRRSYHEQH